MDELSEMPRRQVKAVLFDFDGTLTRPGALDFSRIRRAIGCPSGTTVLEYIAGIREPLQKRRASLLLERFEAQGAAASKPGPGAEAVISFLRRRGIRVGILTRNTRKTVDRALENFRYTRVSDFDVIITRDDPVRPKPEPDGILLAARRMGVETREILVVGDYVFDIQAGIRAGAVTVFLDNGGGENGRTGSSFSITGLEELKRIVFSSQIGKVIAQKRGVGSLGFP